MGQQYGTGMKAVTFASPSVGYLAGTGIILKTSDGGRLFQPAWRGNLNVHGLTVAKDSAKRIVAWGKDKVLVSLDNGSKWTEDSLPVGNESIQEVDFATANEGFAVVGDGYNTGTLWRTTDAGIHWQKLGTPGQPLSVSFGNANTGWVGLANGSIYETKDGGTDWTRVLHPNVQYPGRPMVYAVSGNASWAMIIGQSGMSQTSYSVFHTKDGVHWNPVLGISTAGAGPAPDDATKAQKGPGSSPGPMVALSANNAVVTGVCEACAMGTAQVSSTQNGGSTWTTYPTIPNGMSAPMSMSFVSLTDGWVLDSTYTQGTFLLHTTNGGKSWTEDYPMVHPHPVEGLSFLNTSVGYGLGVPGDANAVLKSTDGGHSWRVVGSLPSTQTLKLFNIQGSSIDFVTESLGYAVGLDGIVYETHDGGRTWTMLNLPSTNDPFTSVTFIDNGQVGMVTTQSNAAAVTLDGGKVWHLVQIPGQINVNASADVYLSGLVKQAVASTLKTMVQAENPGWLEMSDGMAWMPVQNGQGFFITTDGGVKWRNVDFGQNYPLISSLDFVNREDGWMITAAGALLQTTDGGRTWVHASHPHS